MAVLARRCGDAAMGSTSSGPTRTSTRSRSACRRCGRSAAFRDRLGINNVTGAHRDRASRRSSGSTRTCISIPAARRRTPTVLEPTRRRHLGRRGDRSRSPVRLSGRVGTTLASAVVRAPRADRLVPRAVGRRCRACIRSTPTRARPRRVTWPSDQRTTVTQILPGRTASIVTGLVNLPHAIQPMRVPLETVRVPQVGGVNVTWTVTITDERGSPTSRRACPEPVLGYGTFNVEDPRDAALVLPQTAPGHAWRERHDHRDHGLGLGTRPRVRGSETEPAAILRWTPTELRSHRRDRSRGTATSCGRTSSGCGASSTQPNPKLRYPGTKLFVDLEYQLSTTAPTTVVTLGHLNTPDRNPAAPARIAVYRLSAYCTDSTSPYVVATGGLVGSPGSRSASISARPGARPPRRSRSSHRQQSDRRQPHDCRSRVARLGMGSSNHMRYRPMTVVDSAPDSAALHGHARGGAPWPDAQVPAANA